MNFSPKCEFLCGECCTFTKTNGPDNVSTNFGETCQLINLVMDVFLGGVVSRGEAGTPADCEAISRGLHPPQSPILLISNILRLDFFLSGVVFFISFN